MNIKVFNKYELYTIIACFFGIGICYGIQYSFSIFFVEIIKSFNSSNSSASMIFAITLLMYGIYAPFAGFITNRFGGRTVFKFGSIVIFIGFLLSSLADNMLHLYLTLGIITSIGINSAGFIPVTLIISNNFQEKKGFAMGLASTGVGVGVVVISLLSEFLIKSYGWRISMLIVGLISSILIFVSSNFLPATNKSFPFKLNLSVLGNKNFWYIQFGMTFSSMTTQGLMLHLVSYFIEKGSKGLIPTISISIIGVTGILGRVVWGFMSDHFKPLRLYIAACFMVVLSLLLILFSDIPIPESTVLIFSIIYGFAYGSFAPLFPILAFHKFKNDFGSAMGLLAVGNGIGSFITIYLMGYIRDVTGSYEISIIFLIILTTLSVVSYMLGFKKS